jgi:SAM-dependent methyltransferase
MTGSEPYSSDNLLDRVSRDSTLAVHYRQMMVRERELIAHRLPPGGRVVSVGAGWHPGRHLFPSPQWHLVAVDADPDKVAGVIATGQADEAHVGYAGKLDDLPDGSFQAVLYRLVLHHLAFQGPLQPCFAEAARLLAPGGALVAIEPGLWHPIGVGLALANRVGVAEAVHGTRDDIPLSPRRLVDEARAVGLRPELHAVTYTWRRLPPGAQRWLQSLDALGSRPRAALFGHTLMLIAHREPG